MDPANSITYWLNQGAHGDHEAATRLWNCCFLPMVHLARQRLGGAARQLADEEDVALSAFASFFAGLQQGNFPLLSNRNDLWGLLVTITARKAVDLIQHNHRQKRGGGLVVSETVLGEETASERPAGLDQFPGQEPTPEFVACMNEACGFLLDKLADATLQQIALLKLEGYRDAEIAVKLNIALRSVERKLKMIRTLWASEIPS